jgi:Bacterial SH3 domain
MLIDAIMTFSPRALASLALSGAFTFAVTLAFAPVAACSSPDAPLDEGPPLGDNGDNGDDTPPDKLVGVDDSVPSPTDAGGAGWVNGTKVRTTADLNLRDAPSATAAILRVIPAGSLVTILDPTPQNGFWNIEFDGVRGWASGTFLEKDDPIPSPVGLDGPSTPANALARARASVGFSYWWGGGAWLGTGVTADNAGTCSGTCGNCSHGGAYGADCSGLVAKAWQYGTKDLAVNSHPYSTGSFVVPKAGYWSDVSRGALQPGDALVYNASGAGHVVLWEKGDGWGSSTVYECKGCSYGCVHDTRTFTSNYKGIRRDGF